MNLSKTLTIAATATLAAFAAQAQDKTLDTSYVNVMGTYFHADNLRETSNGKPNEGAGIQLGMGRQLLSGFGMEMNGFADLLETGDNNGTDFYRAGAGIDLFYALGDRSSWTPFAILGGGAVYNDIAQDERDDWDAYANAGLGAVSAPFGRYDFKLRIDARYIYDNFIDGGNDDYRFGLGIELPLRGAQETQVVEVIKEQIKVVEVSTGVTDLDDDGVIDSRDQCPNTLADTRVDGSGCELGQTIDLDGVSFETNSDRLRPDAVTILQDASSVLQRYPQMRVEVAGHTDNLGSDTYNLDLSQKRTEAVRRYLINAGVLASQLSAQGYGESEPRADNSTLSGREANRRVELRIQN